MLRKYLSIYATQIKNNFVREAVYRSNFITVFAIDFVWVFVELGFFSVIYARVPTLAGWTREQAFFFLGVFFASDSLFSTFFNSSFWRFSDLVHKGELDILLTKPANTVFLAVTRSINLTSLFNVAVATVILTRYSEPAGFPGGVYWLLVPLWVLVGVTAQFLMRFTFSVGVFWTERNWALVQAYYQFYELATRPDGVYPPAIRYVILTVLPFALIGSVPTRALLFGITPGEGALLAFSLVGFTVLNFLLWRAGLRRYQSVSS
ncbi:MAG: ABC-2 family transporter protein [Bdellovibrionota bacterium]